MGKYREKQKKEWKQFQEKYGSNAISFDEYLKEGFKEGVKIISLEEYSQ